MSARIEGVVQLEALVGADGSVQAVRITRRLHPDLDENAIRAMRAWKFKPGTFDGKAVGVIAEVDLKFTRH